MEDKKPKECYICQGELEFIGEIPVRTHGTGGIAKLVFGQYAELGEGKMPIDVFRCKKCGHLEMYDLDLSLRKQ